MPVFLIPAIAIGAAAGVAAAGAIGVAIKKRKDKKSRQKRGQNAYRHQEQRSTASSSSARPTGSTTTAEPPRQHQERAQRQQRRLPPYDRDALVKALDYAIAKAADDTLNAAFAEPQLAGLSQSERIDKVSQTAAAMRSALGNLRMPDYNDDIAAAAYLLQYHASHVGLAHAVINQMVQSGNSGKMMISDNERLHIVDLAAGTLAMQFGAAIAVAEALTRSENIQEMAVDSIDINPKMLQAGQKAWDRFIDVVSDDDKLTAVSEACQRIKTQTFIRADTVPNRNGECWLSCLHGVYEQNCDTLRQALQTLHSKHRPVNGLLTCWGSSDNSPSVQIAKRISPFKGTDALPPYFLTQGSSYEFLFDHRERRAAKTGEVGLRWGVFEHAWVQAGLFWRPTSTAVLTYQRNYAAFGDVDDLPF